MNDLAPTSLFDPQAFRDVATALVSELTTYLRQAQERPEPALRYREPRELYEIARRELEKGGRTGESPELRARELAREFLSHGTRLQSPHAMGHQVNPPLPLAGAFQLLGGVTNPGIAVYEMSQFPAAIERALVHELLRRVGWSGAGAGGESDGIVTSGGSLANFTALLTARNARVAGSWKTGMRTGSGDRRPAILVGADAHYSVKRAAGMLGLGTEQVVAVPLDSRRRLDPSRLGETLSAARERGLEPFAVVGSACSTPIGAFDPLDSIGEFARREGLWFHVDAAHGGPLLFSARHRGLLKGIELADSITWDAHKLMFVPSLCTFVLYRRARDSYQAFEQDAPYLFGPDGDERAFDGGLRTVECTKGAIATPLWAAWSTYGPGVFEALVDRAFEATRELHRLVRASGDFEAAHDPEGNIYCFRLKGASDQRRVRDALVRRGDFYVTGTELDGSYALRVTITHPLIERGHLERLLRALREVGR